MNDIEVDDRLRLMCIAAMINAVENTVDDLKGNHVDEKTRKQYWAMRHEKDLLMAKVYKSEFEQLMISGF